MGISALVHSVQAAKNYLAEATRKTMQVPRRWERFRTRLHTLMADKGYDSETFGAFLRWQGLHLCILRRRY